MGEAVFACRRHADLVAVAMGPDATDADLVAYAEAVPGCGDCKRALDQGLAEPSADGRVVTLAFPPAPPQPGLLRLQTALSRRRWLRRGFLAGSVVVAAAAALLVVVGMPTEPVAPGTQTVAVRPAPAPGAFRVAPARVPLAVAVVTPEDRVEVPFDDAVAALDVDWPEPAFADLRRPRPKGLGPAEVAVRLDWGGKTTILQHEAVDLWLVAGDEVSVAVCVSGPENGVIWRGAVSAGRTRLARDGEPTAFQFDRVGVYRLLLGCDPVLQEATIEVVPP